MGGDVMNAFVSKEDLYGLGVDDATIAEWTKAIGRLRTSGHLDLFLAHLLAALGREKAERILDLGNYFP
ncbi:MAG: hypothetical protein KGI78_02955 [Patescibacteria group bacterium]|nr:hypothetical protein [Patescibacteria group bacterium]MDE1944004.1 hypothetical protein [Patescibacteria group bacterium]MDE1945150.1 hypothetical protein [Patescibacteria group bacterium]MDE2057788.1 hypothetical protein [Patescibacteria group bacterium]